jgi:sugar lactone lactonase YvrE
MSRFFAPRLAGTGVSSARNGRPLNPAMPLLWVLLLLLGSPALMGAGEPDEGGRIKVEDLVTGLYDAENLAFDSQGRLFVSAGDHLYMVVPKKGGARGYFTRRLIDLKAIFAGVAVGPDGCLYAACYHKHKARILRIDITRSGFPYTTYLQGNIKSPNGLRFDDSGNLYAADFGYYVPGRGKLWMVEPDPNDRALAGSARPIVTGLWGPNGIAMDRARNRLYFTETLSGRIYYLEGAGAARLKGPPVQLINIRMPGPRFPILDDLALDEEGNLWVCHYNGNRVLVVSPEGELIRAIEPPGIKHPTALAFGVAGKGRDSLYITQKGHMFLHEERSGDRLSRIKAMANPYALPFTTAPPLGGR